MKQQLTWDENKRNANRLRHGLDFAHANFVLNSPYRLDADVIRDGEQRTHSFAYVFGELAVLSLVHTKRSNKTRIISFRRASTEEREVYYEWLANTFKST